MVNIWNVGSLSCPLLNLPATHLLIGRSPHEIVYDFRPRYLIDLIPVAEHYRASETASAFASHMHKLHKKISNKIAESNANYKLRADVRNILRTFCIGDFLMVQILPERFPLGIVEKLHAHSASPFQIFKKLNDNAYVIDLSKDFDISSTFNVEDPVEYKGPYFNTNIVDEPALEATFESLTLPPLPNIFSKQQKRLTKL